MTVDNTLWSHVTAGMHGCTGAAKEMIYGPFFLVQFKTAGVKLEDGLDIFFTNNNVNKYIVYDDDDKI